MPTGIYIRTKEIRESLSKSRIGRRLPPHTEETKKKISVALKGKTLSEERKQRLRDVNLGKTASEETKKKMSQSQIGLSAGYRNPSWKGGITPENNKIKNSLEYRQWRLFVLKRDNYICQFCNKRGGKLQAHHLKSFAYFPKFRFELSNGKTACFECHKRIHFHRQEVGYKE